MSNFWNRHRHQKYLAKCRVLNGVKAQTRGSQRKVNQQTDERRNNMTDIRKETDSLGEVDVAADKLWGAQTQRSLEHFSIGKDLIPLEMVTAYATLKKA